jgi:hypothetical protein
MNKIINHILLQFKLPTIKAFVLAVLVVFLSVSAFILIMQTEEKLPPVHYPHVKTQIEIEKLKRAIKKEISIEKTAQIIVRDGKNIHIETANRYAKWIYAAGERHKVNPVLILSVMSVESNFNAKAESPTGPIGLLQIAYSWHKEKTTRVGLFDPKNNINVGTRILAEYRGSSDTKTLHRYYGGDSETSSAYARKVISYKHKYEKEIKAALL